MALPKTFTELCEAMQDKKISNVIGIVIEHLPPRQSSKGDWMCTFKITDGSTQHPLKVRLFCKDRSDIPSIQGPGDAIILNRVRWVSAQGEPMLVSQGFGSIAPWAVIPSPIPQEWGIAGPRVLKSKQIGDVSREQVEYAMALGKTQNRNEFSILSEGTKEKLTVGGPSLKRCDIKDLGIGVGAEVLGEVIKIFPHGRSTTLYITDYTENSLLYNFQRRAEDDYERSSWTGPPGKYTLQVECFYPNSDWVTENVQPRDFVVVSQLHIKANPNNEGQIEAACHGDKIHPEKLRVRKVKGQVEAQHLLLRKEELGWAKSFDNLEAVDSDPANKKRKNEDGNQSKSAKNRERKLKRRKDEENLRGKDSTTNTDQAAPSNTPRTEIRQATTSINENIRCTRGSYATKTIQQIRHIPQIHNTNDPDELTSYAAVRVVDFKPSKLEDFARRQEMTDEEVEAAAAIESTQSEEDASDSAHSVTSLYGKSTQVRKTKWVWNFMLLLEDASSNSTAKDEKQNDQLIVYVEGADGEHLLGEKALDLRTNPTTRRKIEEKLFILWGDLAELKAAEQKRKDDRALHDIAINTSSTSSANSSQEWQSSSRPFQCLIEEYGAEVRGQVQRRFRMKGTTIMQGVSARSPVQKPMEGIEDWDAIEDTSLTAAKGKTAATTQFRAPRA